MIFLVQALLRPQTAEDYRRFIGSPEHLRRMSHHVNALAELTKQRIRADRAFRMISIGMGSPAETSTLRNTKGRPLFFDGPFAESKEVLAGFNLIDFPTRDEAVEFARNEHVHDAEYTQVVRGVSRLWWGDSIKSGVAAKLFILRIYAVESPSEIAPAAGGKLARHIHRVGAEYAQGRGTIDDNNLAWSVALLEPFTGTALRSAAGTMTTVDIPRASDGRTEVAFVLVACGSVEEANRLAEKLASHDDDVIEVRSVTRYSWTSLD